MAIAIIEAMRQQKLLHQILPVHAVYLLICFAQEVTTMTDLNRGIMKFRGADSGAAIVLSACLILGGIAFLIVWALQTAYTLG